MTRTSILVSPKPLPPDDVDREVKAMRAAIRAAKRAIDKHAKNTGIILIRNNRSDDHSDR